MKSSTKFRCIILTISFLFYCFENNVLAQSSGLDNSILSVGEKISIHSDILDEDRDIWIYLPPNYTNKYYQTAQYPVLYLLDGDVHFQSVSGMVQILGTERNGMPTIPEIIIVAIPSTNPTRDLTPSHSLKGVFGREEAYLSMSGGGDNFLEFMKEELIPKIDSTYSTLPFRIFIGHSLGGTEVIHALYTTPSTFNAYVSIDPALWWNDRELVKKGDDYLNSTALDGKYLYLAQANTHSDKHPVNNHYDAIKEFASLLEDQSHTRLRRVYQYYPNDTHTSVAFIAEYDALRFIFEKYFKNFGESPTPKALEEHYSDLSEEFKVDFLPPERLVQQQGRIALFMNDTSLAARYFQMNIDNYPRSSSAYADMGQLSLDLGKKKEALKHCEKSLSLYPENKQAKQIMNRLQEEK